jgi:hypothetical protein
LSPPVEKEKGKEAEPGHRFPAFPAAAREPTRCQRQWRVGRRVATVPAVPEGFLTLFPRPKTLLNTVPACGKCSLKIPDCFGAVIVILM